MECVVQLLGSVVSSDGIVEPAHCSCFDKQRGKREVYRGEDGGGVLKRRRLEDRGSLSAGQSWSSGYCQRYSSIVP
jgi:hypothetical protein